ncbi:MAG: hypothetical protein A3G49_02125 [Candidatus Sungbacteria bacterium RIFCSPLOWO2_12_FULL_41_11]|uniref:DUF1097 domain-containing protein n=1 Tax=Candidatus Sungbacteria bacterium RIFCSPLOWO2_12_FULL_41_11 TaxID=1802286 RepID=A0A1G2LNF3_9BACT|nr:MAG: hypothetical protein UV01_C0004G0017 [Parcubacteria group bacterium GW2011_GWA2_42_14]OGZ99992.1 MAG: hypothetical protein A3D41_03365 [Candidatus Sungbacteria bacterium RIFCSPHIGHO2_02_FULL_41_12b]OHA13140.1 MAG: hypothetical protein A3G49_02125 [Candidatus Sungbacteria bacterium RIFCSPLOWO2_12_FULL_41_11]
MQPKFLQYLPVAAHIGLWVFIWLWAGLTWGLVLWIPFISWSMWYIIGPTFSLRKKRFNKNLIGAVGGTVYAIVFILLIPVASKLFGFYGIPVLGFFAGLTIVLLELTNLFEYAMSYFFTFGSYFAFAFAGKAFGAVGDYGIVFAGTVGPLEGYMKDVVYFLFLVFVGFLLGFITDIARDKILKMEGLADDSAQKTIFDREAM